MPRASFHVHRIPKFNLKSEDFLEQTTSSNAGQATKTFRLFIAHMCTLLKALLDLDLLTNITQFIFVAIISRGLKKYLKLTLIVLF